MTATQPKLIEANKFRMEPGTAGSIAARFVALLEAETIPVDPIIRSALLRQLMKPLLRMEIRGGKWAHPELQREQVAAHEHYLQVKAQQATSSKRKRWKG